MVAAKRQKGATIIEYVLLAALIGVVSIAVLELLGAAIAAKFTAIKDQLL
jgi:Flp pilus assembly pilin Flp